MDEYIEREKTVELLRSLGNREYRKEKGTIQDAIKMISYPEYTPTADVTQVVRCKYCKHKGWVQEPCHGKSVDCCRIWDCTLRNLEATFCSYGERKDGES